MYYLLIKGIYDSIIRLNNELQFNPLEHRTASIGTNLVIHYFQPVLGFITTPEQAQHITNKRPDIIIELDNKFIAFVEFKRALAAASFDQILEQLETSIIHTIDGAGSAGFVTYLIAMKGTKIAFYYYISSDSISSINNNRYGNCIPLNYQLSYEEFCILNPDISGSMTFKYYEYMRHSVAHPNHTSPSILKSLGVECTPSMNMPHIFDLANPNHEYHIHTMFTYMASNPFAGSYMYV